MKQYRRLLEQILLYGVHKEPARDNMPATTELFDETISIVNGELPILNYKKVSFNNVLHELLWFLGGNTNIKYLVYNGCNIWNDDAYRFYLEKGGSLSKDAFINNVVIQPGYAFQNKAEANRSKLENNGYHFYGDCGRIYGSQWRNYGSNNLKVSFSNIEDTRYIYKKPVDQISNLITNLKTKPNSRYHIVDAWNPQDMEDGLQALPACHMNFVCNVRTNYYGEKVLDLSMTQRSCDMFLGVPYNLLSYAILQRILCEFTGYKVGVFKWHGMSCHIYDNQVDAVNEYIDRCAVQDKEFSKPTLEIDSSCWNTIDDIKFEDFKLVGYEPMDAIKCKLSTGLNND